MAPVDDRIDLDFLLLADWAEIVAGKLYLQGGGWERVAVPSFPFARNIAIVVGLTVPWGATNQRYTVRVTVLNEDTQQEFMRVEGQLETGRPAGLPPGQAQSVMMAVNNASGLPAAGTYLVAVEIDGEERGRKSFRAEQVPGAGQPR